MPTPPKTPSAETLEKLKRKIIGGTLSTLPKRTLQCEPLWTTPLPYDDWTLLHYLAAYYKKHTIPPELLTPLLHHWFNSSSMAQCYLALPHPTNHREIINQTLPPGVTPFGIALLTGSYTQLPPPTFTQSVLDHAKTQLALAVLDQKTNKLHIAHILGDVLTRTLENSKGIRRTKVRK